MDKFKEGDRVVRTGPNRHGQIKGEIYTVFHCSGDLTMLKGYAGNWDTNNYELADRKEEKSDFFILKCGGPFGTVCIVSGLSEEEAKNSAEAMARANDGLEYVVVQVKGAYLFEKRTQLVATNGKFAKE